MKNSPLQVLIDTLPQIGRVEWIGLRPARDAAMVAVTQVHAAPESGLEGDRYRGRSGGSGKRQVTLIQYEHLATIAALAHRPSVTADMLRRNVVVSGVNLLALKGKTFHIGEAILEYTGPCDPCSKMETLLGPGGYNAMRGHGGITARVLKEGSIVVGDEVKITENQAAQHAHASPDKKNTPKSVSAETLFCDRRFWLSKSVEFTQVTAHHYLRVFSDRISSRLVTIHYQQSLCFNYLFSQVG